MAHPTCTLRAGRAGTQLPGLGLCVAPCPGSHRERRVLGQGSGQAGGTHLLQSRATSHSWGSVFPQCVGDPWVQSLCLQWGQAGGLSPGVSCATLPAFPTFYPAFPLLLLHPVISMSLIVESHNGLGWEELKTHLVPAPTTTPGCCRSCPAWPGTLSASASSCVFEEHHLIPLGSVLSRRNTLQAFSSGRGSEASRHFLAPSSALPAPGTDRNSTCKGPCHLCTSC